MSVISDTGNVATVVATVLAGSGLIYAGKQWALSRKATAAQLLLQIDDLIRRHDQVFEGLGNGTLSGQEFSVRRAMGALERLNVFVEANLVDLRSVEDLHGWRFGRLQGNSKVRERLQKYPEGWRQFSSLSRKLTALQSQSDKVRKVKD